MAGSAHAVNDSWHDAPEGELSNDSHDENDNGLISPNGLAETVDNDDGEWAGGGGAATLKHEHGRQDEILQSPAGSMDSEDVPEDHSLYHQTIDREAKSLFTPSDNHTGFSEPAVTEASPENTSQTSFKLKYILRGHRKGIAAVKISPDGQWIASCSADCTIKIWETDSGKYCSTMEGHLAGISTIAWSPDSKTLASGSDDKSIRLWDLGTAKCYPVPLLGHHNYIYSIAFSPKGNMLVSGSYDEAVFIWDVRTATVMRSLPAHSDPVAAVDFIRDGTLIVSCAGDGLIRIWDTASGQCLRTLVHDDNPPVVSVKFSPNGKFVLAWTLDSCIRLWNYVDGRCVKTYQGHENVRFSLSGTFGACANEAFVASGSEDGSVVLWDVKSKEIIQRLKGHKGPVLGVDTHPSKPVLVSCGADRTVRIWQIQDTQS